MSQELSHKRRRLAVLAAFGLFWGTFLAALGLPVVPLALVVGALLAIAAAAFHSRALVTGLAPAGRRAGRVALSHGRRVGSLAAVHGRRADDAALRGLAAARSRVARIDWERKRADARGRAAALAGSASSTATAVRASAAAGSRRAAKVGGSALTVAGERARSAQRELAQRRRALTAEPGRDDALRLNEQAALLRQQGKVEEALELGDRALALFRVVGDRRGEALTLNGIGLAQARAGDESGAVDSYEMAAALLTELGDDHGAGRVLANLGALHRGRGDEEQAHAVWRDALERLEPGTPEHERTAGQLGAID